MSPHQYIYTSLILLLYTHQRTDAIQCYSCKATGNNEIDANVHCLEKAYLENCDDFYDYYNDVEDSDVLSYEYYYYYDDQLKEEATAGNTGNPGIPGNVKKEPGVPGRQPPGGAQEEAEVDDEDEYYYDDEEEYYYASDDEAEEADGVNRQKRSKNHRRLLSNNKQNPDISADERLYEHRVKRAGEGAELYAEKDVFDGQYSEYEQDKERIKLHSNYDTYDYQYDAYAYESKVKTEKPTPPETTRSTSSSSERPTTQYTPAVPDIADVNEISKPKKMPKDPEHYCYSETQKDKWESYTVEKGCKKIGYCRANIENLPSWSKPWNFCCDRARCNAKLVKDKPQRIFGMGCRRTDDCIQGYNSRPVCPHHFKTCPKISVGIVKMECRVKARTMASLKNAAKYQQVFREKKCYCAKGYFPRGPICTSGDADHVTSGIFLIGSTILLLVLQ